MIVKLIRNWIIPYGLAVVLAFAFSLFVMQPYKVDGHSMDPTLNDNQRIYVSKLSHTFAYLPDHGDIVIIDSRVDRKRTLMDSVSEFPLLQWFDPSEEHIFFVKRVIGKPGDRIEIKEGSVYRNGERLAEPYVKEPMLDSGSREWVVPDGHVFVLGDNRNNSLDSRAIGYIPLDHVMGAKISLN